MDNTKPTRIALLQFLEEQKVPIQVRFSSEGLTSLRTGKHQKTFETLWLKPTEENPTALVFVRGVDSKEGIAHLCYLEAGTYQLFTGGQYNDGITFDISVMDIESISISGPKIKI